MDYLIGKAARAAKSKKSPPRELIFAAGKLELYSDTQRQRYHRTRLF
jgi:hypothetical protein